MVPPLFLILKDGPALWYYFWYLNIRRRLPPTHPNLVYGNAKYNKIRSALWFNEYRLNGREFYRGAQVSIFIITLQEQNGVKRLSYLYSPHSGRNWAGPIHPSVWVRYLYRLLFTASLKQLGSISDRVISLVFQFKHTWDNPDRIKSYLGLNVEHIYVYI